MNAPTRYPGDTRENEVLLSKREGYEAIDGYIDIASHVMDTTNDGLSFPELFCKYALWLPSELCEAQEAYFAHLAHDGTNSGASTALALELCDVVFVMSGLLDAVNRTGDTRDAFLDAIATVARGRAAKNPVHSRFFRKATVSAAEICGYTQKIVFNRRDDGEQTFYGHISEVKRRCGTILFEFGTWCEHNGVSDTWMFGNGIVKLRR